MEVSMSEIIRETRNAINSRLDMLEVLVSRTSYNTNSNSNAHSYTDTSHDNHRLESLSKRIYDLETYTERVDNVESTLYKFNDLISNVIQKIQHMEKEKEKEKENSHIYTPTLKSPSQDEDIPEVIISDTQKSIDEVEVLEETEEEQQEQQEEQEEEQQEEQEEEQQELELEEFEYKNMTLYRDNENKVYQMDEDGALSDPIGKWDTQKNRITKIT